MRGRLGAYTRWAIADAQEPFAAGYRMRQGLQAKFEREVDPQGKLSPQERAKRAEYARRDDNGFLFSHTGEGVAAAFASPMPAVNAAIGSPPMPPSSGCEKSQSKTAARLSVCCRGQLNPGIGSPLAFLTKPPPSLID